MPTTDSQVDTELRAAVDELTRKVDLLDTDLGTRGSAAHPLAQFRSMGEYVKAVAAGDEAAVRAYQGLVVGDVSPADGAPDWAGRVVRLIEERTPVTSWFTHTKDLPPTGMSVEHGTITFNNGLKVAEQVNEGDDLIFGKISLAADGRAKVHTIGGWTDLSRQAIERTAVNVIDLMWRGFVIAYARDLERRAAATLRAVYDQQVAAGGAAVVPRGDLTTADGVIDLLVDLAVRYETSPYRLHGLWVSEDVFRPLAKIKEDRKALQITSTPADKLGTLSLSSLEANLSNIDVRLWAGAPAGAMFAADREAVKVQESPGAPFRLQDENIVNLTKQFSVYGYVAAYSEFPEGLVPIVPAS